MKRKIQAKLLAWKERPDRLPLLLTGARQIGKTYSLKEFGREHFRTTVYLNFEEERDLAARLELSLRPADILREITELKGITIEAEHTLLIFDEIQASERALTSLKYFAEEAPEYFVVGAGSLLGVKINRESYSFPVGKVQLLSMYPLDFEEYLWAQGKSLLAETIRRSYQEDRAMPELLHQEALLLYKRYLLTGGMPGVVRQLLAGSGWQETQQMIYNTYVADIAKYTEKREAVNIHEAYDSLPAQLAKENKKFQYKVIRTGGRAAVYKPALSWLLQAGIVLRCRLLREAQLPLAAFEDINSFKLYYSDTGIFTARTSMTEAVLANSAAFSGAFTENYVAASLRSNGYELYYWTSGATAEVDFIITKDDAAIPVECKAGIHTKSKSLTGYIKKYNPPFAIRISAKNFGFENKIKSIPLYAVFCV